MGEKQYSVLGVLGSDLFWNWRALRGSWNQHNDALVMSLTPVPYLTQHAGHVLWYDTRAPL